MFLTGALYNLYIRFIMNQHKVNGLIGHTIVTLMMCLLNIIKVVCLNRACKIAADEVIYLVYYHLIKNFGKIIFANLQGNRTIEIVHSIYACGTKSDMQEEVCFLTH